MARITHYRFPFGRAMAGELCLSSDVDLNFVVKKNHMWKNLAFMQDGVMVASVLNDRIFIRDEILEHVKVGFLKYGLAISREPEKVLIHKPGARFPDCTYSLADEVVARVTHGAGLLDVFLGLFRNGRLASFDPYTMIEFNENHIEPLLAVCLLLMDSCVDLGASS